MTFSPLTSVFFFFLFFTFKSNSMHGLSRHHILAANPGVLSKIVYKKRAVTPSLWSRLWPWLILLRAEWVPAHILRPSDWAQHCVCAPAQHLDVSRVCQTTQNRQSPKMFLHIDSGPKNFFFNDASQFSNLLQNVSGFQGPPNNVGWQRGGTYRQASLGTSALEFWNYSMVDGRG